MKDGVFEPKCHQSGGFFLSRHILDTSETWARVKILAFGSQTWTQQTRSISKRASIHTVTIKAGSKKQLWNLQS